MFQTQNSTHAEKNTKKYRISFNTRITLAFLQEWIQFEEIGDLEERAHSMYFEKLLQTQALPGSTGALQTIEAPISCPAATGNADDDVSQQV